MTDVPPELAVHREAPDRNLALELVRVTEAAAMAAGRWVGRGDKNGGDGAAVDAMRTLIGTVSMRGVVVIGEGEKDEAPMLYNGEQVGDGTGPECDVAVDPIDGTTLMAKGMPNAIAVLAVAERGTMYDPSAVFYMEKLATGPEAADVVDITAPPAVNVAPGRQGQGRRAPRTSRSASSTGRGTRTSSARSARPAPGSSSSPTATSPARSWPPARAPASTCCSASAARRRASSPPARSSCLGGVHPGPALAPDDAERQKAIDAGHDLDRVLHDRRPGQRATTSSSSPPASPTASCCAASATGPAVRNPVDRHALQVRHDPRRRQLAPADQAPGVLLGRLRQPRLGCRRADRRAYRDDLGGVLGDRFLVPVAVVGLDFQAGLGQEPVQVDSGQEAQRAPVGLDGASGRRR